MKILIDNGHGKNTAGKCSPDKSIREYAYTREIAKMLVERLVKAGYDASLLTPEDSDVSITQRVLRANNYCSKLGAKNVVLISLHLDAKGMGSEWNTARGFSARVAFNASTNSKRLAKILTTTAVSMKLMGNRAVPKEGYWSQDLGICRMSHCPAVLTESGFMTNKDEVKWMLSSEGKNAITELHFKAIQDYLKW